MPKSLHRTWAALAVAAFAVLVVAFLSGRDFVRDVYPECSGSLVPDTYLNTHADESARLFPVVLDSPENATPTPGAFQLRYDTKAKPRTIYGAVTEYSNVRIAWSDFGTDGKVCTCGEIPIYLSGEAPSDISLFKVPGEDRYLVKGRAAAYAGDVRASFTKQPGASRHLQSDRVFSARHLSLLVVWLAFGALAVALVRSRRAMAYALRFHTWTEARLNEDGMIENESGATIGALEQSRVGLMKPGPILVAKGALSTSGLYRDMPIIAYQNVVEGDHARWASGTMLRLRDARALAVISTLCTLTAFGARLIA